MLADIAAALLRGAAAPVTANGLPVRALLSLLLRHTLAIGAAFVEPRTALPERAVAIVAAGLVD